MNYVLVMTEGKVELEFLKILLERKLLIFDQYSLLFENMYHARQLDNKLLNYIQQTNSNDKITIYRVGDKMSDELKISQKLIKNKIETQIKVCTLPEFEILIIINENLMKEYIKSKEKPSVFVKSKFKLNPKQSSFIREYFNKFTNKELINILKEYKRITKPNKNYITIYDILKVD